MGKKLKKDVGITKEMRGELDWGGYELVPAGKKKERVRPRKKTGRSEFKRVTVSVHPYVYEAWIKLPRAERKKILTWAILEGIGLV